MTRVANTVPGLAVVIVGGSYFFSDESSLPEAGAVVPVIGGALLAYRGFRLGVDCSSDVVVVRGLLRDRRVDRSAVVAVTDFPALRWRSGRRRLRWTPIIAFAQLGAVLSAVARHNDASIEQLRRLLRR